MSSKRKKIAFFIESIEPVGGIETWIYYVSVDLQKYHDVSVFYDWCAPAQLRRLVDKGVKCQLASTAPKTVYDILFRGYRGNVDIKAKRYVQTIHACFSELPEYHFVPWDKTTHYMAVSKRSKASFLELFSDEKLPITVVSNYVPTRKIPVTKPISGAISMVFASRLTGEKGVTHLIEMLKELERREVNYHLDFFTILPRLPHFDTRKVSFVETRLDIDFSKYHYLIQLSDTEAYGYSIHEALNSGTAVIVKDLPSLRGIVKHGYNGYIYPDIDDITNVPIRFKYKPTGSVKKWLEYIDFVLK